MVFLAAGFILPRFIDRSIGQTALGVWDFCWSIINYISLIQLGIGSSVNRYVAKHRAEGDVGGLNIAVSSVTFVQFLCGVLVLVIVGAAYFLVPVLWGNRLGEFLPAARMLVLLLGVSLAVRTAFGGFGGVVTGCHRWDLYNGITAGGHGLAVAAMIAALFFGHGLIGLGACYAAGSAATMAALVVVAHWVCPELKVRPSSIRVGQALEMFRFGGKTFMQTMSRSLLYQTTSVIIITFLGPAALAVYSRPMALVNHVRTFVIKFAHTLTPVASQMDAAGNSEDLAEFLLETARYSAAMALPPIIFLSVFGGTVLNVWMGRAYEQGLLLSVLALGHLTTVAHQPLFTVLIGIDAHGKPSLLCLLGAILSSGLCYFMLASGRGGIIAAATSVVGPLVLVDGVFLPLFACRRMKFSLGRFFRKAWLLPVACSTPFAVCLALSRTFLPPLPAIIVGGTTGGTALAVCYWRWILPHGLRDRIAARITKIPWASAR